MEDTVESHTYGKARVTFIMFITILAIFITPNIVSNAKKSERIITIHKNIAIPNITIEAKQEYPHWINTGEITINKKRLLYIINELQDYVMEYSFEYNVNPAIVYAMIYAESMGNPRARSVKNARGLMQLMPMTADYLGVHDCYNPMQNIEGGCRYVAELYDHIGYDEINMLHAWNAGLLLYSRNIVPYETRNFVSKVLYVKGLIEKERI